MRRLVSVYLIVFFFNDTATTEIYTLSLHDALPISRTGEIDMTHRSVRDQGRDDRRSEEHTSELQSRQYLVCRLLLEKKKHNTTTFDSHLTRRNTLLHHKR